MENKRIERTGTAGNPPSLCNFIDTVGSETARAAVLEYEAGGAPASYHNSGARSALNVLGGFEYGANVQPHTRGPLLKGAFLVLI